MAISSAAFDDGSNGAVRFNQDVFAFEEVAQGATSITLNIIEQL